jgi:hypothetical protein
MLVRMLAHGVQNDPVEMVVVDEMVTTFATASQLVASAGEIGGGTFLPCAHSGHIPPAVGAPGYSGKEVEESAFLLACPALGAPPRHVEGVLINERLMGVHDYDPVSPGIAYGRAALE